MYVIGEICENYVELLLYQWQFYESALTDHKNAFLFITKTHKKVHKNAWKKSTKRIDLKQKTNASSAKIKRESVRQFNRSIRGP